MSQVHPYFLSYFGDMDIYTNKETSSFSLALNKLVRERMGSDRKDGLFDPSDFMVKNSDNIFAPLYKWAQYLDYMKYDVKPAPDHPAYISDDSYKKELKILLKAAKFVLDQYKPVWNRCNDNANANTAV